MRWARWRAVAPALAAVLVALVATCAPAPAATRRPPARSYPVTLHGSLLRVQPAVLTVQEGAGLGTVAVTYAPTATPIYVVTDATPDAIEPGWCAAARGALDPVGTMTASALTVSTSVDGACPAASQPPPAPLAGPSPPPGPNSSLLSGQVLSVGGGAVAIGRPEGDPQVVLLPRGVPVFFFQPAGPSALAVPSCVVIQGTQRREEIAARRIVVWPAGTGC